MQLARILLSTQACIRRTASASEWHPNEVGAWRQSRSDSLRVVDCGRGSDMNTLSSVVTDESSPGSTSQPRGTASGMKVGIRSNCDPSNVLVARVSLDPVHGQWGPASTYQSDDILEDIGVHALPTCRGVLECPAADRLNRVRRVSEDTQELQGVGVRARSTACSSPRLFVCSPGTALARLREKCSPSTPAGGRLTYELSRFQGQDIPSGQRTLRFQHEISTSHGRLVQTYSSLCPPISRTGRSLPVNVIVSP